MIGRRGVGVALAVGLLLGGAAGCGDDDHGDGGGGTEETSTTAGDGAGGDGTDGGGGENDVEAANDSVIQEYCDAADAYAEALEGGDPAALEAASGRLGEASDAVAPVVETFTPEQAAQFEECSDATAGG